MRRTISYVSTSVPELTLIEIQELLRHAENYNNQHCITGILIYSDGNFFQVLEGETQQIVNLYQKICVDSRHREIIKIMDQEKEDHSFSKYYASFTAISNTGSYEELQHFLQQEQIDNPAHYKNIFYLTRKFLKLS